MECIFHSIAFDNGIYTEFGHDSTIMFYNSNDKMIMQLDPSDLMVIYASHRAMVRECMEEGVWSNKELL